VPARLAKGVLRLELAQQVTHVTGQARLDGRTLPLKDVRLLGDRLSFALAGRSAHFHGKVSGKRIAGTVEVDGVRAPWSASLGG
jgi:hypothetical protein